MLAVHFVHAFIVTEVVGKESQNVPPLRTWVLFLEFN